MWKYYIPVVIFGSIAFRLISDSLGFNADLRRVFVQQNLMVVCGIVLAVFSYAFLVLRKAKGKHHDPD
jgi:hypothetical protein